MRWHNLSEVVNECTVYNNIVLVIFMPKIIKVGWNWTKLCQKQFWLFFANTPCFNGTLLWLTVVFYAEQDCHRNQSPMEIYSHRGNKGHSHSHAGCFTFLPIPIPNFVINSYSHGTFPWDSQWFPLGIAFPWSSLFWTFPHLRSPNRMKTNHAYRENTVNISLLDDFGDFGTFRVIHERWQKALPKIRQK